MSKNKVLDINEMKVKSREMRIEILKAVHKAGKGHIGGAFSIVEILVSLFYSGKLKFDSRNPLWEHRDRFILSKGHAAVALYAVLADLGFFDSSEMNYINKGKLLGEHPDPRIPGIENVGGSLGHGLSIGAGMALADKMSGNSRRTYVLMGDGECYEGSVWEGAMFASNHNLQNLCGIVDRNGLITHGDTEQINKLEPFADKWKSFGWRVQEVDAHNLVDLVKSWDACLKNQSNGPLMVIANSTKGKGVTFMENNHKWHHGGINDDLFYKALLELESTEIKL